MVKISECSFGNIVINGTSYNEDILIVNDKVYTRIKELSKKYRKEYGHTPLSLDELKEYIDRYGKPRKIIIGTGHYGMMPITPDAMEYLESLKHENVEVIIDKTPNILNIIDRASSQNIPFMAIVHITC